MSQAYQQLLLDDGSKKYSVINTHHRLFRYNWSLFGIASAPGIFQRAMESFSGIPGVIFYIDDILITGKMEADHLATLEEVLKRLENAGLRKEALACVFGVKRFHTYLFGHHYVLQTDHKQLMTLFNKSK